MIGYEQKNKIPLVQIHDELAFSVKDKKEAEELCKIMESAYELQVPSPSDISLGDNWGNLTNVDKSDSVPEIKDD